MIDLIVVAVASYLVGSFPSGLIVGRLGKGIDVRQRGSGNMGATNSFRVLGWRLGLVVAVLDFAKGLVAVALVSRIALGGNHELPRSAYFIVSTLAAAAGHIRPVFAGFRGGKGFGALAGAITAEFPLLAPMCLAIFLATLTLTGYVAVCASVAALALPAFYLLSARFLGLPFDPVILAFFLAAAALTILGVRRKLALYFRGEADLFERVMIFKPARGERAQRAAGAGGKEANMAETIFELSATALDGSAREFRDFEGKALLIVNTASKCGFTPQYKGLQALHEKYSGRGLVVIGFPCDQFGHQEPGGAQEIATFCERNFGVSFPLMAKSEVNGTGANPVFAFLKSKRPGRIKWNFTKFLVGRDGSTVLRYEPVTKPEKLEADIEAALARG
jgi:acyl-phosphate glycerol 3-phosphate acyltransferase